MKYDVNILALVRQYTPVVLRKAKLIALLDSMTHPLRWLQSKFATYRESVTYRLSITSQVCYLQKLLNDRYDNTDRRIYISDGNQVSETYIYLPAEDIPVYIYSVNEQQPHHIYLEDEPGNFDFIVNYPTAVNLHQAEATALLERNKLASKIHNFNIT